MRAPACLALVILLGLSATGGAQRAANDRCDVESDNGKSQVKQPSGQYDTYWSRHVVARCPAKKIVIKADSMEQHGDEKRIFLIGHVYYEEPKYNVHCDFLTYFQSEERIVAIGNVDAKMANGSTLKGPNATYLRPIERIRPLAKMTATARPTITVVDKDAAGKPTPPMTIIATTVTMDGDSLVYAGGLVNMVREEFVATSDSMYLEGTKETMHLIRNPAIKGQKDKARPFTLTGTLIDLFSKNHKLQRVLSKGKANAVSQDLTLASDTIDLRVTDDVLVRSIAWGPGRATAKSPVQTLLADSIDVLMPGQRVREIHALRKAYAEAKPDTVKFRADSGDMDWLRGNTIIAYFDTIPPKDTTQSPRIKRLLAIGSAAAYNHRPATDSTCHKPVINYSTGKTISADFNEQGVSFLRVDSLDQGITVEPEPACGKKDTTGVKPKKPGPPGPPGLPDPFHADGPLAVAPPPRPLHRS